MEDGDLGYAYWCQVGQLLQRAAGMQAEIDSLSRELERCRAMHAKTERGETGNVATTRAQACESATIQ